MPRKSLLPMLLTTMLLLLGGALVVHRQFAASLPDPGPGARDQISRQATEKERQAGIKSIVAQLNAFRADDYKTAVTFQSNGLKLNFASAAAFRATMKKQYPQFADYKSAVFGIATADASGRQLFIPVKLTGQDGVTVQAAYYLVLEDNIYRIAGVTGGIATQRGSGKPPKVAPAHPNSAPALPPAVVA